MNGVEWREGTSPAGRRTYYCTVAYRYTRKYIGEVVDHTPAEPPAIRATSYAPELRFAWFNDLESAKGWVVGRYVAGVMSGEIER
jgi:hypothetical protein